jgi:cytochrome bd ubiquinol oxidase subunit I
MNDLFFARSQMGMSLAFHIIFAVIGMAMPLLMAVSEGCYLRTKKPIFLELSKRWAAGTTILFAVGAVSGTVLSFELGLLWPKFMQYAGGIIGMPFSLEGFAYPIAAMLNPASLHETIHMVLAAYAAAAFLVAGIHAFFLLRDPQSVFHRASCSIALVVACVSIPLQMVSGDFAAEEVAKLQPTKLAAMEAHYQTGKGVPLVIGGIPNDATGTVNYALQIPFGLSLLVGRNPETKVVGLEDFPRDQWPNVQLVHLSFDIMVGAGSVMFAVAACIAWIWWRTRRLPAVVLLPSLFYLFQIFKRQEQR